MSQSNIVSTNIKLIGGLQKYGPKKTIVLAGKTWSIQDLIATFTSENNAIAASTSAKADWVKAAATVKADRATNDVLRVALHQAVLVLFGADPSELEAFGYKSPGKRGPVSLATKVIAAAKRIATRKARGTLGSKQRKAIHGVVSAPQEVAVTVTPTANAAAAPTAAAPVTSPDGTQK